MSAEYDPFDYPDDEPEHPPPRPPVDHDDDESAFWRDVREHAGEHRQPHRGDPSDYAEWMAAERAVAFRVPCVDCKMGVDQPCVHVGTNEPLRKFPAHVRRMIAARKLIR